MRSLKTKLAALAALALSAIALTACGDDPAAQQAETKIQQNSYERLAKAQPAKGMSYSPTRETINFWIDTWNEPNKLSYIYLLASNGQLIGYYIFDGPPVNACAALTPTYRINSSSDGRVVVPAPSVDGVYYSGGQCATYYGKDATSGTYIEYTAGQGISALVYSEPLPRQNVEPLGFAQIGNPRGG